MTDVRKCPEPDCGEEHDIDNDLTERTWMQWRCPSCGAWVDRPEALATPESPV